MDLTISRPVKILLLVLVLAGVGGIASLTMLGKSSPAASSTAPIPTAAQLRAQRAAAAAHKTATTATTTTAAKAPAPAHKAVAPQPQPKPAPKPKATTAPNGLPIVLFDALRAHRIVVVSVFDPQSQTDAVSYAEARAGAADAHAGFLGVSVLDDSVAGPLTAVLPDGQLLPVPGILVFRRPGVLVQRIDGFTDRDSVAALAAAGLTAVPYAQTAAAAAAAATTTAAAAPVPAPAPAPTTTAP